MTFWLINACRQWKFCFSADKTINEVDTKLSRQEPATENHQSLDAAIDDDDVWSVQTAKDSRYRKAAKKQKGSKNDILIEENFTSNFNFISLCIVDNQLLRFQAPRSNRFRIPMLIKRKRTKLENVETFDVTIRKLSVLLYDAVLRDSWLGRDFCVWFSEKNSFSIFSAVKVKFCFIFLDLK